MKASEANRIAKKIKDVIIFVNDSMDNEGNLTKGQVNKVVKKLNKIVETVGEVNVKSKKRLGNAKGKQVMMHQTATELHGELYKVLRGFEVLAANTKKKKVKTIAI